MAFLKYFLCSGKVGTSSLMAKNFLPWQKNLLFMADVFSGKMHHSAVINDFRCQGFRRFFTIASIGTHMAKNMSYGKKSCLNTILKWEKSYHFSLTSNFELAVIFSPIYILWQIINKTKGTKNINVKKIFDPLACRVGGW